MAGSAAQESDNRRVELALLGEAVTQFAQFGARGKLAEPEQVAGFFEVRMVGEFVNIDAAIREDAAIAVDLADPGVVATTPSSPLGA